MVFLLGGVMLVLLGRNEPDQNKSQGEIKMPNHNGNVEKLNTKTALELIFATANASSLEHQRINPARVQELSKTLGRWKRRPHIVATPRGVVLEGIDAVAAVAAANDTEVEVSIDRTASGTRREARKATSLVEQLTRAGITHSAFKLAVWRGLREGEEANPGDASPRELVAQLSDPKFVRAFEDLLAPYELISARGISKASRVRSKIAFAAFLLAYHANPKKIIEYYTDFLSGKAKEGSPLEKLLHAVRTDNINTGSGRRPFMLKASILLRAQLAGDTVERAFADEKAGGEAVAIFKAQLGHA